MKEHPIIFSTEMVKAILEGRKTQTRRVVKYQVEHRLSHPYYKIGDVLWVKETWKIYHWSFNDPGFAVQYKDGKKKFDIDLSDDEDKINDYLMQCTDDCNKAGLKTGDDDYFTIPKGMEVPTRWRSPLYMPRSASRINLKIKNIRAERLQDITEEDCVKEGVRWMNNGHCEDCFQWTVTGEGKDWFDYADDCYEHLWNKINGKKYPWKSNPWVWVIDFEVVE